MRVMICGDVESLEVQHCPKTIQRPAYRIGCDNCGASTGYSDRGEYADAWNSRQPDKLDQAIAIVESFRLHPKSVEVTTWADIDLVIEKLKELINV